MSGYMLLSGLISILVSLFIALIGAGILWKKTRTMATSMFFFGYILSVVPSLLSFFVFAFNLATQLTPIMAYSTLATYIGMMVGAIGLTQYALLLPKK